jgi:hypothetical protein
MNNDDMKQVEKRVRRYWYTDGIAELAVGGMFVLLGLYFGIQGIFEDKSPISVILQVSLVFVMIAGFTGVGWLVKTIKARLTYPRTGYVEYRVNDNEAKQRRRLFITVAIIITAASIVLVDFFQKVDGMVLATGVLVGVIFISLRGKSSGVQRFYITGSLAIVLGIVLSFSKLTQVYNLALFYGLLGVASVISGALVLRGYLRDNPAPLEGDNE